ncbi:MAG: hypothetical protein ACI310_05470 [Bacilli bacterium]
MKDYSLNDDERKNFVLNYDKTDESITVNFAGGNSYVIPNTESNENKLESKMIEQVLNCDDKESRLKKSNTISVLFTVAAIILASIGLSIINGITIINKLIISIVAGIVLSIPVFIVNVIVNNKLLKDIKKNKFFVEHQEVINRGLNNTNVLANSDVKVKQTDDSKTITINDIDYNYSFNDLKTIVDNANREEHFEFDTFPEEERPKTRRRKR